MENIRNLSRDELERQIKLYAGFLEEDEANIKELRAKVDMLMTEFNRRYGRGGGPPDDAFRA